MKRDTDIPVRALCAMFGLNPNTIRTWERRYGFPSPARGEGSHRMYTSTNIEQIGRIVALMDSGATPRDAVRQVINAESDGMLLSAKTPLHPLVYKIQKAAANHDQVVLQNITRAALKQIGYRVFIEEVAFPALVRLGVKWESGGECIAAEHALSMVVEGVILQRTHALKPSAIAPAVTFACVPDELHCLPLLHFSNLAVEQKTTRPLILSAGLPISEIIAASKRVGASIILLSATIPPSPSNTRAWIGQCVKAGWAHRVVLAGPGFMHSRVYVDYPVRAIAGSFDQGLNLLKTMI